MKHHKATLQAFICHLYRTGKTCALILLSLDPCVLVYSLTTLIQYGKFCVYPLKVFVYRFQKAGFCAALLYGMKLLQ